MATQVFTLKITYADCGGKIWRTAAVSSNYSLAELGYLVLATFDTMAYHQFDMKYNDTIFILDEEAAEDLSYDEKDYDLLASNIIGKIGMIIGDTIEMTYDMGLKQTFIIELIEIGDIPKGHGRAYPKILDGEGCGIIDDMPASELFEIIGKIDTMGHSDTHYSSYGDDNGTEWDYRNYRLDIDNALLKGRIDYIRDGYEGYDD